MSNYDNNPATYGVSSQSAETSHDALSNLHSVIGDELAQVAKCIRTSFDTDVELIQTIGAHISRHGGKNLRPMTIILSARAFGYEGNQHIQIAAILEFIHAATLLHDDVVDESSMRRGQSSANSIWGNAASILVGDFLYSRSFEMMVAVKEPFIFDVLSHATRRISEGEVMQLMNLQATDTSEEQYFGTIERKTASLFQAASQMGAVISGQSQQVCQQMAEFGQNLGIAFQLIDDVLDYAGDTVTIGKKVGDDLAEGKLTLPLIHTLDNCHSSERRQIESAIRNPVDSAIEDVYKIVASSGALEYTTRLARRYSQHAKDSIEFLPNTVFRQALFDLAGFACDRNF